jgi:hypothetical protein
MDRRVGSDQKARLIPDVGRPKVNSSSERWQPNQECYIRLTVLDLIGGGYVRVRRRKLDWDFETLGQLPTEIRNHARELSFLVTDRHMRQRKERNPQLACRRKRRASLCRDLLRHRAPSERDDRYGYNASQPLHLKLLRAEQHRFGVSA